VRFTEINLFGVYVAPMSVMLAAAWFPKVHFGFWHDSEDTAGKGKVRLVIGTGTVGSKLSADSFLVEVGNASGRSLSALSIRWAARAASHALAHYSSIHRAR
jgi:hypothetical protein